MMADLALRSTASSEFNYFACSSSDNSLSECSVQQRSCNEICSIQYGLKCFGIRQSISIPINYSVINQVPPMSVPRVMFVLLMVLLNRKGELKYALMDNGVQYVVLVGLWTMLM